MRKTKKQRKYPLVPPEGKGDVYFPRSDIPRPIFEDFRKMREKERKFDNIRRMMHKKKLRR